MKTLLGLFVTITCSLSISLAQYDNVWMMGHVLNPIYPKGKIEFTNGSPDTSSLFRPMPFFETNASICDSLGDILFYTNGVYVANRNHDTLQNSSNFNPGYYTSQITISGLGLGYCAIIIPNPGNPVQYYIFHKTADTLTYQGTSMMKSLNLRYSIVDMTLSGGLGGIPASKKTINIINDTLNRGLIMACKHGNGRDWWVLTPRYNDSLIYKVLVTPDTVLVTSQVTGSAIYYDGLGSSIFSPDGSKYVLMTRNNLLDIFDFDRCSGTLLNHSVVHLPDTTLAYIGAAISPDNHYLYVGTNIEIYQLDLTTPPYSNSIIQVAQWDTVYNPFATWFDYFQLGPDGKIYIGTYNGCHALHVIDQPDSVGLACNVLQNSLTLAGPGGNIAVPHFPNYHLGTLVGSLCDTLTGIASATKDKELSLTIAPNPVTDGVLHIRYMLPQNKAGTLTVTDITGKQVYTYRLPQWSTLQNLPLQLAEGMYFCTVASEGMRVTKKFVVCVNR